MKRDIFDRIMYAPDDPGAGGAPAPDPKPDESPETKPSGLTNKEVNDLIKAKEVAAVGKLLKELGVESTGKLKDDLKLLKDVQDKDKTEAEKLAGQNKEFGEKLTAAEARAIAAETKAEAMIQGVDPAKVDRAAKLIPAYDGETAADKVKAFLAENPEFLSAKGPVMPTTGKVKSEVGGNTALKTQIANAFSLKGGLK